MRAILHKGLILFTAVMLLAGSYGISIYTSYCSCNSEIITSVFVPNQCCSNETELHCHDFENAQFVNENTCCFQTLYTLQLNDFNTLQALQIFVREIVLHNTQTQANFVEGNVLQNYLPDIYIIPPIFKTSIERLSFIQQFRIPDTLAS